MKEEKKESPIGVLWGWGKPYHGKFIGSVILAVLGVACQMVPYFCVAHIVTMMLSGEQNFPRYVTAGIIALCGYFGKVLFSCLSTTISHTATYYTLRDLRENITARRILTAGAIENAIALTMATAGSTNLIMHLPAIAREAGLTGKFWSSFDRASREIPQIVAASPSGPCHLQEVDRAGGTRAILRTLMPKLHGEALTVTGRTLAENYADSPIYDPEVIRPLDRPVRQDGSLYVLYGSLAPAGCSPDAWQASIIVDGLIPYAEILSMSRVTAISSSWTPIILTFARSGISCSL